MDEKTNELNEKLKYTKETLSNTKETLSIETTRKVNSGDENISYKGEKTIDKLHDNVKYYCEKINFLENQTAGAKLLSSSKIFIGGLIFVSSFIILMVLGIVEDSFVEAMGTLFLPLIILFFGGAYNAYLTADQIKYDCRDKLFENLEQLKLRDAMCPEEKELYEILVSEYKEIPKWLQKKNNKKIKKNKK